MREFLAEGDVRAGRRETTRSAPDHARSPAAPCGRSPADHGGRHDQFAHAVDAVRQGELGPSSRLVRWPQLRTYPQLRNGSRVNAPSSLVRRLKSHVYTLPAPCGPVGVDVFLGLNGYIWVCQHSERSEAAQGATGLEGEGVYSNQNDVGGLGGRSRWPKLIVPLPIPRAQDLAPESRLAIALVCNIIRILARASLPLTDGMILAGYRWAADNNATAQHLNRRDIEEDMLRAITGMAL